MGLKTSLVLVQISTIIERITRAWKHEGILAFEVRKRYIKNQDISVSGPRYNDSVVCTKNLLHSA